MCAFARESVADDDVPLNRAASLVDKVVVEYLPEADAFAGTMPYEEAFLVRAKYPKDTFRRLDIMWGRKSAFKDSLDSGCPESLGRLNGVLKGVLAAKSLTTGHSLDLDRLIRDARRLATGKPIASELNSRLNDLEERATGDTHGLARLAKLIAKLAEGKTTQESSKTRLTLFGEALNETQSFGVSSTSRSVRVGEVDQVTLPIGSLTFKREYRFCTYQTRVATAEEAKRAAARVIAKIKTRLGGEKPLECDHVSGGRKNAVRMTTETQQVLENELDALSRELRTPRNPESAPTEQNEVAAFVAAHYRAYDALQELCRLSDQLIQNSTFASDLRALSPAGPPPTLVTGWKPATVAALILRGLEAEPGGKRLAAAARFARFAELDERKTWRWAKANAPASDTSKSITELTRRVFSDLASLAAGKSWASLAEGIKAQQGAYAHSLEQRTAAVTKLAKTLRKEEGPIRTARGGLQVRPEPHISKFKRPGWNVTVDTGAGYFFFAGEGNSGFSPTVGVNLYFQAVDPSVEFFRNVYCDGYLPRVFSLVFGLTTSAPGTAGGLIGEGGIPYVGGAVQPLPFTRFSGGLALARTNRRSPFEGDREIQPGGFVRASVDLDVATLIEKSIELFSGD